MVAAITLPTSIGLHVTVVEDGTTWLVSTSAEKRQRNVTFYALLVNN